MTFTHGDLFTGIGGFTLAADWMGWSTRWSSEIEPFAIDRYQRRFPGIPNLGDITRINWNTVARVNLLTGGFPCQPHSLAGKRKGKHDTRDLWPEYWRAIRDLRPDYVCAENVPGLLTSNGGRFFDTLLGSLAQIGYDAEWTVFGADDVGAPHRRDRLWIVAYPEVEQERAGLRSRESSAQRRGRSGNRRGATTELDDRERSRLEGHAGHGADREGRQKAARSTAASGLRGNGIGWSAESAMGGIADGLYPRLDRWPARPGSPQEAWEAPRVSRKTPYRKERLMALGNAIVPLCAYVVMQQIERRRRRGNTGLVFTEDA